MRHRCSSPKPASYNYCCFHKHRSSRRREAQSWRCCCSRRDIRVLADSVGDEGSHLRLARESDFGAHILDHSCDSRPSSGHPRMIPRLAASSVRGWERPRSHRLPAVEPRCYSLCEHSDRTLNWSSFEDSKGAALSEHPSLCSRAESPVPILSAPVNSDVAFHYLSRCPWSAVIKKSRWAWLYWSS